MRIPSGLVVVLLVAMAMAGCVDGANEKNGSWTPAPAAPVEVGRDMPLQILVNGTLRQGAGACVYVIGGCVSSVASYTRSVERTGIIEWQVNVSLSWVPEDANPGRLQLIVSPYTACGENCTEFLDPVVIVDESPIQWKGTISGRADAEGLAFYVAFPIETGPAPATVHAEHQNFTLDARILYR